MKPRGPAAASTITFVRKRGVRFYVRPPTVASANPTVRLRGVKVRAFGTSHADRGVSEICVILASESDDIPFGWDSSYDARSNTTGRFAVTYGRLYVRCDVIRAYSRLCVRRGVIRAYGRLCVRRDVIRASPKKPKSLKFFKCPKSVNPQNLPKSFNQTFS